MNLVTHQTGPEGREVRTLLIEEGLPIDKEFYLGIVLDRATGRPVFMASSAGGMDIEEVAANTPELILKETIDPAVGFRPFQARKLAFGLGLPAALVNQAAKFMQSLYHAYEQTDASLARDQPVPADEGRPPLRARRQDHLRRQRDVPPHGLPLACAT